MRKRSTKRPLELSQTAELKRQSHSHHTTNEDASSSSSMDEEYEVEAIVGLRDLMPGQTPQFFVKWNGYDDVHNTWEPIENLGNCQEILKEFLSSTFKKNAAFLAATTTPSPALTDLDGNRSISIPSPLKQSVLSRLPLSSASSTPTSSASSLSKSCETSLHSLVPSNTLKEPLVKEIQSVLQSLKQTKILTASDFAPKQQLSARLKAFEDIFRDSGGPKISIENTVDDAACPPGFKYLNDCIYGKGVEKPDPQFSSRCECGPGECSVENGCPCMNEALEINDFKRLPFEKDGKVSELASRLLWECNTSCTCGPTCVSRVSQQGRRFAMKIKRFPNKGWGVELNQNEPIPPRTFVARYTGEIILNQEADIRGRNYDQEGATWLFDLDYNTNLEAKYSIDAYKQGNESHFFNHSCDPNLSVYMLVGGDTAGDSDMMTLSFWSNRWIHRGDELTFDYNGNYLQSWFDQRGSKNQKHLKHKKGMTPCFCGASKCKKWVYI